MSGPGTLGGLDAALPPHVQVAIESRHGDAVGDLYSTSVGVLGTHLATSNVPILAVQWYISGGTPATANPLTQTSGGLVPVSPADLAGNPLVFAFTVPGEYYVRVRIYTEYGVGYAENSFYVTAPTVTAYTAVTGQVYVGQWQGAPWIRLGVQNDPAAPGITLTANVQGSQQDAGTVAMLQIATDYRVGTDAEHRPYHETLNGRPVLDVGPGAAFLFYQNEMAGLAPGGAAILSATDAPGQQLGPPLAFVSIGDVGTPEQYDMYVVFCPTGGIWVPVAVLHWTWEGYTQLDNGTWTPATDAQVTAPPGQPATVFPTWNANTTMGSWVPGASATPTARAAR